MKERPILFSAPMVKAILEGRKTQTRRIVKPQPAYPDAFNGLRMEWNAARQGMSIYNPGATIPAYLWRCPYGVPGDELWGRETWADIVDLRTNDPGTGALARNAFYKADYPTGLFHDDLSPLKWRPSIHMPRWASRITLVVKSVRVERLQDISQADAIAEGGPPSHPSIDAVSRDFGYADFSRSWYAQLWESINGEGSWDANPWVWVIEFEVKK